MENTIKLSYHAPCRCCRTLFRYEKILCSIKNGQIVYVKAYPNCINKTKMNNIKFGCCDWFSWTHI